MKDLLKRILGRSRVSYDELRTCIATAAAVMNDRPLTTVTEDTEDLTPLTPAMFLKGLPRNCLPELENVQAEGIQQEYKRVVTLKKELQERFRKEYLGLLIQTAKAKKPSSPKVGDVVIIGADNKKRI